MFQANRLGGHNVTLVYVPDLFTYVQNFSFLACLEVAEKFVVVAVVGWCGGGVVQAKFRVQLWSS